MARRQVEAFIKADPVAIIPLRKQKIDDGAGGWIYTPPQPRTPITATIVPAKRRLADFTVNTELGDLTKYPFILLARAGEDLERDDTFLWRGDLFEVKSIYIETDISTTAQIDYFGGESNG